MKMSNKPRSSGFSLIELSIVLVIVGLIAGGILLGRDLIRQAQLRRLTSEMQQYATIVNTFRSKFNAMPGDMANATRLWGADTGQCTITAINTAYPGAQTCDGNGDGKFSSAPGDPDAANYAYETFRFWQHLYNAGLIDKALSGTRVSTDGPQDSTIGVNVPALKSVGGGVTVNYRSCGFVDGNLFLTWCLGNAYQIGAENHPYSTNGPLLTPLDAFSVDSKTDDGLPGAGKIGSTTQSSTVTPDCTTDDAATAARYNTTDDNVRCSLFFLW